MMLAPWLVVAGGMIVSAALSKRRGCLAGQLLGCLVAAGTSVLIYDRQPRLSLGTSEAETEPLAY